MSCVVFFLFSCAMSLGRKRGAAMIDDLAKLSVGDLVVAKVKGFPPWPAKVCVC